MKKHTVKLKCIYCDDLITSFELNFGEFLDLDEQISCEVVKERPGIKDMPLYSAHCENCGCVSGLRKLNQ